MKSESGVKIMERVSAFFSRSGRILLLRSRVRALERERISHLMEVGRKTYELWRAEKLTDEAIKEECQGVQSVEEEIYSLTEQIKNMRESHASIECSSCGRHLFAYHRYCPFCGTERSSRPSCPQCAEDVDEGDRFCGKCGAAIDVERRDETS